MDFRARFAPNVLVFDEYFNYPNWERHEFVRRQGRTFEYLAFARQQVALRVRRTGPSA